MVRPAKTAYDASSLEVLEGLDPVRKRPGMYIGSTDTRGLTHLAYEIIDNSVDEALAGFCTHIEVVLHADGSISVEDDGRGIPVDKQEKTGLSGLELVFTKLHAGGKFSSGSYGASGGLHGVGAAVVNALSTRLDAEVDRGGKTYGLSFNYAVPGVFDANGKFKPKDGVRIIGTAPKTKTGTRVRYWPDKDIFLADAETDVEAIYDRVRQTAFLVPGLKITITDQRGDDEVAESFVYTEGLTEFTEYLAPDRPVCDVISIDTIHPYAETIPVLEDNKMVTKDVAREMEVHLAFRWGIGYEPHVKTFCNIVATPKGGTHLTGFERGLVKTINEAARTQKLLKDKDDPLIKDDVLEGLTAVVLVRLPEPQFEGQTKEILGTPAAQQAVSQALTGQLKSWLALPKNKAAARAVLTKCVQAAKARKALRLQKETIRRKTALESSSMPAKLSDCRTSSLASELFLIEGDSAAGSAKKARDSEFQALLPLRGKILNVMRASERQMLDNAECAAIITAIGAGSGKSFDLEAIRYGKLIIMTDADVDGAHIRCLLLTLCYRYMRPLLENGNVYAAVPPLHRLTLSHSGEHIYTYTTEEFTEKMAEFEAAGKKVKEIQRYKGLGEMDADQLAETTVEPSHRKLRQMTMEDAEEAEKYFDILMGQNVAPRKDFIIANSGLIDRESLDL